MMLLLAALFAAGPPRPLLEPVALITPPEMFWADRIDFSADGRRFAASGSNDGGQTSEARVWDLAERKPPLVLRMAKADILSVRLAASGEVFGMSERRLDVWDGRGKLLRTMKVGSARKPEAFALLDGGKALATAWPCVVLDSANGKVLARPRLRGERPGVFGTRRLMATREHQDVDLWDIRTGKLLATLADHAGETWHVALRRDEKRIAAVATRMGRWGITYAEVRLWDAKGKLRRVFPLGAVECAGVALSDDGRLLAICTDDGLRVLDARTGREAARLKAARLRRPLFAPGGGHLAATAFGGLHLWSMRTK